MEYIINKFLRAKAWQLFALIFGIPIAFEIISIGGMVANIGNGGNPNLMFSYFFALFPILMLIFMGVFFGWFWAIAIGLQEKIPADLRLKVSRFKIFFSIPFIYMLFLTIGFATFFRWLPDSPRGDSNDALLGISFAVIVPLHLFSMFCIFYCLYFVAKTIKTAELQRKVTFSDYAGEFMLIWLYFVGVWVIQPRSIKWLQKSPCKISKPSHVWS